MKKKLGFATALIVATIGAGAAISAVSQELAYPTGLTHATPEMQAAFPDLF